MTLATPMYDTKSITGSVAAVHVPPLLLATLNDALNASYIRFLSILRRS